MVALSPMIMDRARQALDVLSRQATVRGMFVFGSQVSGEVDDCSDIDLAAFVDEAETWSLDRRVCAIIDVQREAGDDLDLHVLPGKFIADAPAGSFAAFVLHAGIKVDGSQRMRHAM